MSSIVLPKVWASDTNYTSGSASGTATKTDPGAALRAQGIIPGTAMAQHINNEWNLYSTAVRQAQLGALRAQALDLRALINGAVTITDTAESCAAVSPRAGWHTPIVVKTGQSFRIGASAHYAELGVPPSITSLVTDAATDGGRIVVVGTGGNRNVYSDDNGSNWSAGATMSATPKRIIWNEAESVFMAGTGTTDVRYSADPSASWTLGTSAGIEVECGLACVSNGDTFGLNSVNGIRKSTDGGSTWSTVVGAVPNAGNLMDSGCVIGNNGGVFWHCGRFSNDGTRLQVASSPDGITWTSLATIARPSSQTFGARPRIMLCQTSGLMVIVVSVTFSQMAVYASHDLGVTWTEPVFLQDHGVDAYAVAGGRLIYTHNDLLMASLGVPVT